MSGETISPPPDSAAPETQRKEAVDPRLLQAALNRVRTAADGNGIKPATITLDGFDGAVCSFPAWIIFRLRWQAQEKKVNGRAAGEIVTGPADIKQRMQDITAQEAAAPDVVRRTIALLKKRPDRGFGAKKIAMKLEHLRQNFVVHEPCAPCGGQGQTPCKNCQGQGRTYCAKCHGNREVMCPGCHGTRMMMTAHGNMPCMRCQGAGRIGCDMCQQVGAVPCRVCRGAGGLACPGCGATGWHSLVTTVEVRAEGHFDVARTALPGDLAPLVDAMGGRLAAERHAAIKLREDDVRYALPDMGAEDYVVMYDARLPWGRLRFRAGKTPLPAMLFGFTAQVRDMPPFLEKTAADGLRALDVAARSPAQTVGKLRAALQYRILSEAALGVIRQGKRRTYHALLARYPAGIGPDTLRRIVRDMDRALRQVTKAPRLAGLCLALAATATLDMLYFAGPGRRLLEDHAGAMAAMAGDAALFAAGFYMVVTGAQFAAMRALDRTVGKLMPPGKRRRLLPRGGGAQDWGGMLGVAIIYAVALAFAGEHMPDWLRMLLDRAGL